MNSLLIWGIGAAGSASDLRSEGQGFGSLMLHYLESIRFPIVPKAHSDLFLNLFKVIKLNL